jgi:hypothetical protein
MKISDEIKVALVTAACIIIMAVISKSLSLQLDFVSQYAPSWTFIIYIITREQAKCKHDTLYWSIAIVAVTAMVLALYSF